MRKIPWTRMAAVWLLACMIPVGAVSATTQDEINDAKNRIDELQDEKEEAEEQVDTITDRREELEGSLGRLNGQLSDIVGQINDLERQLSEKETEIDKAEEELTAAVEQYDQQYEDMKLRIQFMYENSDTNVWQMLLESASFTDFLNRTEYVSDINAYDRSMLKKFEALREEIAERKKELEGQREELVSMQQDMQEKKNSVNSMIAATQGDLEKAKADLSDAQASVDEVSERLAKMIEYEKELEIKKAKEDAARLAAIKAQEQEDTSGVVYVPETSDTYLLGAIIQCESGGESYEGKLAVGSVVMNRVKSSYFPNTIAGVIYEPGQFSPVASGRLAYCMQTGVDSACLQAAQEVLNGKITVNCLYFRVNNGIIQGTVIGNHVFY